MKTIVRRTRRTVDLKRQKKKRPWAWFLVLVGLHGGLVLLGQNDSARFDLELESSAWERVWLNWCEEANCMSTDTTLLNIREFAAGEWPPLDTAEIIRRMSVLDAESPMDLAWNPIVHPRIAFYSKHRRRHLGKMLGRAPHFFPVFEAALDRHDMPLELKYLPIVESGLNPAARSPMGARGLWQFMYYTAKANGLRIDSYIDERRDPERSSEAACQFLRTLHDAYGDWALALAAYNAGPGNVNKAIRRSGGNRNYWEIRHFLPRETRNYVPAFLAVVYLMSFPEEHNIYPIETLPPALMMDTLGVRAVMRFDQISEATGIPESEIALFNPMYRLNILPGEPEVWPLRLPQDQILSVLTLQDSILSHEPEKTPAIVFVPEPVVYRVKSGDVLGTIARRYGVTVSQLKEWNDLRGTMIRAGQKLYIHADPSKL